MDARSPADELAAQSAIGDADALDAVASGAGDSTGPDTSEDTSDERGTKSDRPKAGWKRQGIEWLGVILVAVLGAIVLRTYVVETFSIPSGSMYPTLGIGDRILVDRLPFFAHDIHRGDIIVFNKVPGDTDATNPEHLVKRVIGLPGETISSRGDTVLIDGKPIAEPWLPSLTASAPKWLCNQTSFDIPTQKIAPGHYFVMGDCRGNSYDSRAWGTVPTSYIVGRVFAIIWHSGHPWFHWF